LPATPAISLRIVFGENIPVTARARIKYAFQVFAAIYNYRIAEDDQSQETLIFAYGILSETIHGVQASVVIPARYSPEARTTTTQKVRYAGEDFFLFHGLDPLTNRPDWLGEIFEWLSSSHEANIAQRDNVGRIPDSEMIFNRIGLRTWKPHAAMLMAWLEHVCRNGGTSEGLAKAPSAIPGVEHLVVCSHDIDFYFTNRRGALLRLLKNLAISCVLYKTPRYFIENWKMLLKLLGGKNVGHYLPSLLERMEQQGCHSTLFVVAERSHRRDPNYEISALAAPLAEALRKGFSVELHGCYQSVIENRSLEADKQALAKITGKQPLGSRQHWLRFGDFATLFRAVEDAALVFDSSVGFSDHVGFRSGACFAFPPYDFQLERPHNFLEIPLAIMDGSLIECSRKSGESAQTLAERVLSESRKYGWGGISILWHNPLEALSVPDEINEVFWKCAAQRQEFQERWVSSDEFLALSLQRYQNAGLLTEVKIPPSHDNA
jgi:hypothetical protein